MKKITEHLNAEIKIGSNPKNEPGATITILFAHYKKPANKLPPPMSNHKVVVDNYEQVNVNENFHQLNRQTILVVEDNISMVNYLIKKLDGKYNAYAALNGMMR